jgi:hypothetical protein
MLPPPGMAPISNNYNMGGGPPPPPPPGMMPPGMIPPGMVPVGDPILTIDFYSILTSQLTTLFRHVAWHGAYRHGSGETSVTFESILCEIMLRL